MALIMRREGIFAMNNPRRMLLFLILASALMFALGVFVGNRYTVSLANASAADAALVEVFGESDVKL